MRVRKATWPSRPGVKPGGGGGTASWPWSDPGAVGAVVTASSSSWLAQPSRCIGGGATGDRVASVTGGAHQVGLHIAWWVRYPGEGVDGRAAGDDARRLRAHGRAGRG